MIPATSRALALSAACVLTAGLCAQSDEVLPPIARQVDGNEQLPTAFQSTAFRLQQIVEGPRIAPSSAVIQSLALRADRRALPLQATVIPNLTLQVSETMVSPFAMGEGFAQNVTGTPTTVFQGALALPAETPAAVGPAPFSIAVPFSQPLTVRTGLSRHLLLDFVATDAVPTPTDYALDAAVGGGSTEEVGRFGTLGTGDNLNFVAFGTNGPSSLAPGGQVEFATTTSFQSYPGATLLGLLPQQQAIDLGPFGAPGNAVYVDPIAAAPHAWQQTFIGWAAPVVLALPQDQALVGASLWAQGALLEPGSNALGVVTTAAGHVVIGDTSVDPLQAVVATDPAAGVGTWAFGRNAIGGAVVQLFGTFQ